MGVPIKNNEATQDLVVLVSVLGLLNRREGL